MSTATEIRLTDKAGNPAGVGNIWEPRPDKWSWAHPNGSEGCNCPSFEAAEKELNEATDAKRDDE